MSDGRIDLQHEGHVLTVTLDRPERKNAFGGTMREDLAAAFEKARTLFESGAVRVIVLRGAGDSFCAGGDVANLLRLKEAGDEDGLLQLLGKGERAVRAIRAFPGPVVAAIDGPAVGAGMTLALACDLRICSARSRFGMAFVKIALHPDWGGSWLLAQAAGEPRARELAMTGRLVDADEAAAIGLVHRCVPDSAFDEAVDGQVRRLARSAPRTLALIKQTFVDLPPTLDEGFAREREAQKAAFATDDAREGFAAFLEKRRPAYQGG